MRFPGLVSGVLVALLATGCKLQINVPVEGGAVTTASGNYSCGAGQQCVIDVTETSFDESFQAAPADGYSFAGWKRAPGHFCGNTDTDCNLQTTAFGDNSLLLSFLTGSNANQVFFLEPVFTVDNSAPSAELQQSTLDPFEFGTITFQNLPADAGVIILASTGRTEVEVLPVWINETTAEFSLSGVLGPGLMLEASRALLTVEVEDGENRLKLLAGEVSIAAPLPLPEDWAPGTASILLLEMVKENTLRAGDLWLSLADSLDSDLGFDFSTNEADLEALTASLLVLQQQIYDAASGNSVTLSEESDLTLDDIALMDLWSYGYLTERLGSPLQLIAEPSAAAVSSVKLLPDARPQSGRRRFGQQADQGMKSANFESLEQMLQDLGPTAKKAAEELTTTLRNEPKRLGQSVAIAAVGIGLVASVPLITTAGVAAVALVSSSMVSNAIATTIEAGVELISTGEVEAETWRESAESFVGFYADLNIPGKVLDLRRQLGSSAVNILTGAASALESADKIYTNQIKPRIEEGSLPPDGLVGSGCRLSTEPTFQIGRGTGTDTGNLCNGQRNGIWTSRFAGNRYFTWTWVSGVLQGPYQEVYSCVMSVYDDEGNITGTSPTSCRVTGQYVNGSPDGLFTHYQNGAVTTVCTFRAGVSLGCS